MAEQNLAEQNSWRNRTLADDNRRGAGPWRNKPGGTEAPGGTLWNPAEPCGTLDYRHAFRRNRRKLPCAMAATSSSR